jgi:hypothetical protein
MITRALLKKSNKQILRDIFAVYRYDDPYLMLQVERFLQLIMLVLFSHCDERNLSTLSSDI